MKLKDYYWLFGELNVYNEQELYIGELNKFLTIKDLYEDKESENPLYQDIDISINDHNIMMFEFLNMRNIFCDVIDKAGEEVAIDSFFKPYSSFRQFIYEGFLEAPLYWLDAVLNDLNQNWNTSSLIYSKLKSRVLELYQAELKEYELNKKLYSNNKGDYVEVQDIKPTSNLIDSNVTIQDLFNEPYKKHYKEFLRVLNTAFEEPVLNEDLTFVNIRNNIQCVAVYFRELKELGIVNINLTKEYSKIISKNIKGMGERSSMFSKSSNGSEKYSINKIEIDKRLEQIKIQN